MDYSLQKPKEAPVTLPKAKLSAAAASAFNDDEEVIYESPFCSELKPVIIQSKNLFKYDFMITNEALITQIIEGLHSLYRVKRKKCHQKLK